MLQQLPDEMRDPCVRTRNWEEDILVPFLLSII
jgi:hypothetical protein